ncbi:MAG: OmpA family protein [Flavobacteriales bacterium]|nr:OmpA family protein [Flavobacteriales bacterium]
MHTKFLIVLILFTNSVFAQQHFSDCHSAVVLMDSIYQTGHVLNFGNKKEISGNLLRHPYLFPEEEQSVWYKIPITQSGEFTFELIPDDANDDWDFLVYVSDKNTDCNSIVALKPHRSNISRVDKNNGGKTGLSKNAKSQFVPSGVGNAYSASIFVKENQQIILVTNNWSKSGKGHTLKISLPIAQNKVIRTVEKTENKSENKMELPEKFAEIAIRIFMPDKKTPLIAEINLMGLASRKDTSLFASEYRLSVKPYESFNINASAKGYMFESRSVTAGKQGSKEIVQIVLAPIKEGEKVNLSNIQFYGNEAVLLPTSEPSLHALLHFMKENENAIIEIQGHVNGPNSSNTNEFRKLSDNRAEAVKQFLIENGILEKRLKANGYGNSKMLYPNPVTPSQHAANRRVEIVILKLK